MNFWRGDFFLKGSTQVIKLGNTAVKGLEHGLKYDECKAP